MNIPFEGLTLAEVTRLTAAGKTNDTHEQTSRSIKDILRTNIFTRFNALLSILALIVLAVGSPIDALFGLVVIINSAIGIFQELRAKHTLDRLAIMNAPVAHVVRAGKLQTIPIKQVVLGDVLKLSTGDHEYFAPPDAASLLIPNVQFTSLDLLNSIVGGGAGVKVNRVMILSQPIAVLNVSL